MERLKTYIEGVDDILHGGIPRPSTVALVGTLGTGKSVFVLQTMMNNARRGAKCIYFTTLSEPILRLVQYMRSFGFFDEALVDGNLRFIDLGTPLRSEKPREALERVIDTVEEQQPDIIAIDSYKAVHDFLHDDESRRTFTYDLSAHLLVWNTMAFLVGEYTPEQLNTSPEFAVADAAIILSNDRLDLRRVREIEVLKMRGSGFNEGRHFFEIRQDQGIVAYQRIGAVEPDEHIEEGERIPSGVPGLDELLGGGLPDLSATLIQGASGIGKTLLGLHFIQQAALQGDHALVLTFDERPAQLLAEARALGLNIERKNVEILFANPVEMAPSQWLEIAQKAARKSGVKRVMIDSLSTLSLAMTSQRHYRELIYTAVKMFRSMGVTLIMTLETRELLRATSILAPGLSEICDNVIIMRYAEVESQLKRAIAVLKMRGKGHISELRELVISEKGMEIVGPFKGYRGVLTGERAPEF